MAFVVEDGTGLATANAYISVADARAYWSDVGVTFSQPDSTPTATFPITLQMAIVAATRYMELRFKSRFKGFKQFPSTVDPVFAGQALPWPRVEVYDREGYVIEGVPLGIRHACAEYMSRVFVAPLAPDPDDRSNLKREKIGPIEFEFVPGGFPKFKPYPTADGLLAEFTYSGGYCTR